MSEAPTPPNKHSTDWQLVRRWNQVHVAEWTRELQSLDVAPDRAQQLRGMIFALQEQIEFVEPTPKPLLKDVSYGYDS